MRTSAPEGWGISWRGGRACACRARSTVWRALGRTTFRRPKRTYSRARSSGGRGGPMRRSYSSYQVVRHTVAATFDGKVALVAGASRGIGAATARAFAAAGAAAVLGGVVIRDRGSHLDRRWPVRRPQAPAGVPAGGGHEGEQLSGLEMRTSCEKCHAALSMDGPAFICTYEW